MADKRIAVDGVHIALRDEGSSEPGLVLLHGFGQNLAVWDGIVPLVAGRHRTVRMDLRGHGESDFDGDWSLPRCVEDLRILLERVGLPEPVLVGHSWGAMVIARYAQAYEDVRALLLLDAPIFDRSPEPFDSDDLGRVLSAAPWPTFRGDRDAFRRLMSVAGTSQRLPYWERLENVLRRDLRVMSDGQLEQRRTIDDMVKLRTPDVSSPVRVEDWFTGIECPTMLILGRRSDEELKRKNADRICSINPRVVIEWLDAGHDLPLEMPAGVAHYIVHLAGAEWPS